jgi:hypothetical protein
MLLARSSEEDEEGGYPFVMGVPAKDDVREFDNDIPS